jgi:hypothetical protein
MGVAAHEHCMHLPIRTNMQVVTNIKKKLSL